MEERTFTYSDLINKIISQIKIDEIWNKVIPNLPGGCEIKEGQIEKIYIPKGYDKADMVVWTYRRKGKLHSRMMFKFEMDG
ncbi:hypothetical protein RJG79_10670 [Mycoplasmatota bacterium WC44]